MLVCLALCAVQTQFYINRPRNLVVETHTSLTDAKKLLNQSRRVGRVEAPRELHMAYPNLLQVALANMLVRWMMAGQATHCRLVDDASCVSSSAKWPASRLAGRVFSGSALRCRSQAGQRASIRPLLARLRQPQAQRGAVKCVETKKGRSKRKVAPK